MKGNFSGCLGLLLINLVPSSSSWFFVITWNFIVILLDILLWNEKPCSLLVWSTFYTLEAILWRFPLRLPLSFDESWKYFTLIAMKKFYFCLNFFLFSEAVSFVGLLLGFLICFNWQSIEMVHDNSWNLQLAD